jgi:cell division control protein 45
VAASDVDALCALWILTQLLTNDVIPHKIVPVQGFHDISVQNELLLNPERLADGVQIRSVWMLNCGGVVDLSEFLTLTPEMHVFLLDSHRPLSLDNIFHPQVNMSHMLFTGVTNAIVQITILTDGVMEDDRDVREAFIELQRLEDDEDEDEAEDDDDDGEEEEEAGGDDNGNAELQERRLQRRMERRERRVRRREWETIIADYYSESSYGLSAAAGAFSLSMELSRDNNDFLW